MTASSRRPHSDIVEEVTGPTDAVFAECGYGVVGFFKLIRTLIMQFFIISLFLFVPAMVLSMSTGHHDAGFIFKTTLANSGSSYVNDYFLPLSINQIYFTCENSVIEDYETLEEFQQYVGIIPASMMSEGQRQIRFFGPQENPCFGMVSYPLWGKFRKLCIGKHECKIEDIKSQIIAFEDPATRADCLSDKSMIYAQ